MNKFLAGILLLMVACATGSNESIFWVNSYQVDCTGVGPMKCMLIQKGETMTGNWQNFYSKIEGFEYEPGFIYKLKVKEETLENVPADASSIKYTLVEILEKKEDVRLGLIGSWDAVKIKGAEIQLPEGRGAGVVPQLQIDIEKMQVSGIDNCNNFTGQIVQVNDRSIEWGPLAVTQKMCPDMTIATAFDQALQEVKTYKLEENNLRLMDEEGNELLEFTKGTEAKILLNDIWVAERIDNEPITDLTNLPQLEIHSASMEVMGSDGCNNFAGKITALTNTDLVFGPLAGTRKMCRDMAIPDKFNQMIPQVRAYKIVNRKLSLLDEEGKVLALFKKVD